MARFHDGITDLEQVKHLSSWGAGVFSYNIDQDIFSGYNARTRLCTSISPTLLDLIWIR